MKNNIPAFSGFSKDIFKFLSDLSKNNNTEWFNKNRDRYQTQVVQPARSFVTDMSEFFNRLNPSVRTEPKFNETLMRINKDMRFSKGDPYRNYFLIHFGRFKMDTEFYVYFDPNNFDFGLFINNTENQKDSYFKKNVNKYKKEFLKLLDSYKINGCYQLHELGKESRLIESKFNGSKHLDKITSLKMALLQKSFRLSNNKIYSPNFILEAIKTFSNLYPFYCFSISPHPIKLIEEYEEHFGIVVP